jgi:glycosyl hydrolase family 113
VAAEAVSQSEGRDALTAFSAPIARYAHRDRLPTARAIGVGWHRTARVICAVVCALVVLSGCSIPDRPAWWPRSNAAPVVPPLVVKHEWHPGQVQLGIDVYWVANTHDSAAVIRAKARRIINYAVSLNANAIDLSFPFYTYGPTSDVLYASRQTTPSPAHIGIFLAAAAASHVRVSIRPLLDEQVLMKQNQWRGSIEPGDLAAWFASYQRFLLPYARAAATGHAATFVVGTELESLERDRQWPALIRAVRKSYDGEVLYDGNFTNYVKHTPMPPAPALGFDAYPHFDLSDQATVSQLAANWEKWMKFRPLASRRRYVFLEVGITAVSGAYNNPGDWTGTVHDPVVPAIQRNWYSAVCRAVSSEHLGGIYWWEVSFDADPAHPQSESSDRLTFLGRSAQTEIRQCFATLTGRPA